MGFIVKNYDFFRMQDWYPKLSSNSFPAVFLTLKDAEIAALAAGETSRSEERRVGKECLRLCRSRWSPYH